jgi:hypothetical protein
MSISSPRSIAFLRESLEELRPVKEAALAYGSIDKASEAGLNSILILEKELLDELDAAQKSEMRKNENLVILTGFLLGASLKTETFELESNGKAYLGKLSTTAQKQIKLVNLGNKIKATIKIISVNEEINPEFYTTLYILQNIEPCAA